MLVSKPDVEPILAFWFTGNTDLKSLLAALLVTLVIASVVAFFVIIARLRKWTSYEAWEPRKKRLMGRYDDRSMPHTAEAMELHAHFQVAWRNQSRLVKLWWVLQGVA